MFDIFAKLLSSVASFLFPLFASYKALKTADPAQLTPWLMYWVVLACVLLVESWTEWFLVWIPFYAYLRLLFLLYLVLPQTQGARLIYEDYIHPRLEENETAIEEFIASAAARLRTAGIASLKRAIELLRTNLLGLAPSPEPAAAPEHQSPQSYTQSLLARFTLPSPRWPATNQTTSAQQQSAGGLPTDFYNLLAAAVTAATTRATTTATGTTTNTNTVYSASSIIPEALRTAPPAARASFIQTQRERLRLVHSALDRAEEEEEASRQSNNNGHQTDHARSGSGSGSGGGGNGNGDKRRSVSEQSAASGLSKSRSEGDFEKLDVPSGGEETDLGEGEGVRRRGGVDDEGGAGGRSGTGVGGGWMPWGWGAGGDGGKSSGVEK